MTLQFMKEKYMNDGDTDMSFQFEKDSEFIHLYIETEKCSEGWSITQSQNPSKVSGNAKYNNDIT